MSGSNSNPSLQVTVSSKQILAISLPIALAIMVPQVNFVINNIFLGALSSEALAIGGITGVFYLIFGVMGQGLNNGLQALISRRAGENRVDEIGVLFNQGVIISILLSVIAIAFTYFIAPSIFHSVLHDTQRANSVIEFLKIMTSSTFDRQRRTCSQYLSPSRTRLHHRPSTHTVYSPSKR